MQELVVVTSCDIEFNEQLLKVPASEVVWHLEGYPWVIDMCKEHQDTLSVSQMQGVVEMYGRPLAERLGDTKPKGKSKGEGSKKSSSASNARAGVNEEREEGVNCPYPGCDNRGGMGYLHRGSLASHFRTAHELSLVTFERQQKGEEPSLVCEAPRCKLMFFTEQQRASHMSVHKKK